MKRLRPTLVHLPKIGIANPYQHIQHFHQQQIQRAENVNNPIKKTFNVPLPPLHLNSPPNTCRARRNQFAKSSSIAAQISQEIIEQKKNEKKVEKENENIVVNVESNAVNEKQKKQQPVTAEYVLSNYSNLLFEFEKKEVENYQEIYYIRQESPKKRTYPQKIPNFFPFVQNDHIAYRYQQLELMGKGAFGSVIKCFDHKNGRRVAVKMIRDQLKYHDQTRLERDILKIMQGSNRVVRFLKSFTFRGFFCIVTELLYKDCYTVLRNQRFYGFSLSMMQTIAKQVAEAISFAHKNNIIHCDIKPENVMFTNKRKLSVKLVDYGCSCYRDKILFSYIQSRYFRAPEVALGIHYGPEIDVWSYACVLVELFTGKPLFPANTEQELLGMFVSYFGNPPPELITGKRAEKLFDSEGNMKETISEYTTHQGQKNAKIVPSSHSIDDLFNINNQCHEQEVNEGVKQLCDLIKKCLCWLPKDRITMEEILNHPFITNPDIKNSETALPTLSAR